MNMELNNRNIVILFIVSAAILVLNTQYTFGWVTQFITGFISVILIFAIALATLKQLKVLKISTSKIDAFEAKIQNVEDKFREVFSKFDTFSKSLNELSSKISMAIPVGGEEAVYSEGKQFNLETSIDVQFDDPDASIS